MTSASAIDYRPRAIFLVGLSALVLILLATALQVAAWEMAALYRSAPMSLHGLPALLIDSFGHRPDAYLIAVVFWFWWPKVAVLVYCHHRHPEAQAFAIAFLYAFATCWLVTAAALAFLASAYVYPILMLLLANLQPSPPHMWIVPVVSWCLPVAVLLFAVG